MNIALGYRTPIFTREHTIVDIALGYRTPISTYDNTIEDTILDTILS